MSAEKINIIVTEKALIALNEAITKVEQTVKIAQPKINIRKALKSVGFPVSIEYFICFV